MYRLIKPGSFEPENQYYPKVLNAQLHPMVRHFFNLSPERIINRYCHPFISVDRNALAEVLSYRRRHLL